MQAKRGRKKDFVAALQTLRGKDADISEEAAEIQVKLFICSLFYLSCISVFSAWRSCVQFLEGEFMFLFLLQDYIETLERLPKAKLLDLFQRRYLRSVTVLLLLQFRIYFARKGIDRLFEVAALYLLKPSALVLIRSESGWWYSNSLEESMGSVFMQAIFSSKQVPSKLLLSTKLTDDTRKMPLLTALQNAISVAGFSSSVGTITYAILQVLHSQFAPFFHSVNSLSSRLTYNKTDIVVFTQVIITAIGAALVDKAGRKPLLLVDLKSDTSTIFCTWLFDSFYAVVRSLSLTA